VWGGDENKRKNTSKSKVNGEINNNNRKYSQQLGNNNLYCKKCYINTGDLT